MLRMRAPSSPPQPLLGGLAWGRGFLTAITWLAGVNSVAIALGFLAKGLQHPVDDPVFDAVERAGLTGWTDVLATTTKMGNVPQTQVLAGVLAVALAIWFATRGWRWWMPLWVLPVAWIVSRMCQLTLAAIVDRDRGVMALIQTEIGAYPSGGVARIVIVSGAAVLLVLHYARPGLTASRALWVLVALLGLAEGYFRLRLNQHWLTDVIGGFAYGWLILLAIAKTLRAFDPSPQGEPEPLPAQAAPSRP